MLSRIGDLAAYLCRSWEVGKDEVREEGNKDGHRSFDDEQLQAMSAPVGHLVGTSK